VRNRVGCLRVLPDGYFRVELVLFIDTSHLQWRRARSASFRFSRNLCVIPLTLACQLVKLLGES